MSICISGMDENIKGCKITLEISESHPLIKLANTIDWRHLTEIVLPDLKKTTVKWKWWLGRKLRLRTHLGVYLLQQLTNATDRGIENQIRDNAVYQVFCGKTIVKHWHCPDHTKIEEFRSRLSPETQCFLANAIAVLAVRKKFADPAHIDIDSTVQEPDMQPPSASNLLVKVGGIARNVQKLFIDKCGLDNVESIDMKKIKGLARDYFFLQRKKSPEKEALKEQALQGLWLCVSESVNRVLQYTHRLTEPFMLNNLKVWDQRMVMQFVNKAPTLISAFYDKSFHNVAMRCKIFSFHRDAVDCFNKLKHHKPHEMGRQFQIGRIGGNFVWSMPNFSLRMHDPESLQPMVRGHLNTFQIPILSAVTDKGYYSKVNEKFLLDLKIEDVALQRPKRNLANAPPNPIKPERLEALANRRSGIEPIISHLKRRWQMGRSRMKLDRSTESSGFCAMLGFNLAQMMRRLSL